MFNIILKILLSLQLIQVAVESVKSVEEVTWIGGPIDFESKDIELLFKIDQKYISKNILATRIVVVDDHAIIAMPRYKKGVAVTLGKIPLSCKNGKPNITPYPNLRSQLIPLCTSLQNVVDIYLDSRNFIWVLDTGIINTFDDPVRTCSPKVVVFNAKTDQLVKTFDLELFTNNSSHLQHLIVHWDNNEFTFVVSDATNQQLIAYSSKQKDYYLIDLKSKVSSESLDTLYLAKLNIDNGDSFIITTYLDSQEILISFYNKKLGTFDDILENVGYKSNQFVLLGTNGWSKLFLRLLTTNEILYWDVNFPYDENTFREIRGTSSSYAIPTHISPSNHHNDLYVLKSNNQDFLKGTVGCGVEHSLSLLNDN